MSKMSFRHDAAIVGRDGLMVLVSLSFVAIDYVVVKGKVFLLSHSQRQMFLLNLAEPSHGDKSSMSSSKNSGGVYLQIHSNTQVSDTEVYMYTSIGISRCNRLGLLKTSVSSWFSESKWVDHVYFLQQKKSCCAYGLWCLIAFTY